MRKNNYYHLLVVSFLFSLLACTNKSPEIFQLLDSETTNITFNNEIPESDSLNILINNYLYNGGGVGIADFNNDSLPDVFFAGNLVNNQLYLNLGDLKFEEISTIAGIEAKGKWVSGVNVADINNDGWQDIYLTCSFHKDSLLRENVLYINQGVDNNGQVNFKNEAKKYGLADNRYTTHSIFIDYDVDGDLDLFLINNKLDIPKTMGLSRKVNDGSSPSTDRLYRNNGDETFTDVSTEAGITHHGFGLGIAVFDINEDAYPDIYVSNDFVSNDILWVNQKDGTFKNEIMNYLDHQSFSSMGNNVGDLNNDGLPEIVTLDMLPEEDTRMKMMFGGANHYYYDIMQKKNYEIQYPRNTIQLNQGNGHFGDISMLLDIDATDWSWSPMISDFDNNGKNDLFITNGFPRDISDLDFSDFHSGMNVLMSANERLLSKIPVVKIDNHLYLQQENLQFEKTHRGANFSKPSFSNGAALSDLDRDGDMDLVVNNINDAAFIYENTTAGHSVVAANKYLQISVKGTKENIGAIGSKVKVYTADGLYTQDVQFNRGYCSTSENLLHFGLGAIEKIDSLVIIWQDRTVSTYQNLSINQQHVFSYENALKRNVIATEKREPLFRQVQNELTEKAHSFTKFYDFNIQPQIQKLSSEEGPAIIIADMNNDGLDDCIMDVGEQEALQIFYQQTAGTFQAETITAINGVGEKNTLLAVDLNEDGYKDIYLAKGALPYMKQPDTQRDEIYFNQQGKGFIRDTTFVGENSVSSSVVAADFDKDGDLDLFVGARVSPGNWPITPNSTLYINDNGKMVNQTNSYAEDLEKVGMVTSAIWTDVDKDDWVDLIVVGKWMAPSIFRNIEGKQLEKINRPGLSQLNGLWNSIVAADLDQDGFTDYVLGNQGINNKYRLDAKHPIQLFAKDFDNNGSIDPIISHYIDGEYRPYHLRKPLMKQLKSLSKDYTNFTSYSITTTPQILEKLDTEAMFTFEVNILEHIILWNEEGTSFTVDSLPLATQVSAGNGILLEDINGDQQLDMLVTGNDFGTEVFNGINDAGTGMILLNQGQRNWNMLDPIQSHFYNEGNTRGLVKYFDAQLQQFQYLVARHGGTPILHQLNQDSLTVNTISVPQNIVRTKTDYKDGTSSEQEWHLGEGYKQQSSRVMIITPTIKSVHGITFSGKEMILFGDEM